MSKSGGYVAYLKDEDRADYYSFTEDEYSDYFDNPVEDLDGKVNLDIRGNGHTLMGDLDGRALNLAQGQYANIDNLRIKNFLREVGTENGAALYNAKGEMWVYSPEISGNVSRVVNKPTTDESDPAYVNATVNGGAIYNAGIINSIDNAVFKVHIDLLALHGDHALDQGLVGVILVLLKHDDVTHLRLVEQAGNKHLVAVVERRHHGSA